VYAGVNGVDGVDGEGHSVLSGCQDEVQRRAQDRQFIAKRDGATFKYQAQNSKCIKFFTTKNFPLCSRKTLNPVYLQPIHPHLSVLREGEKEHTPYRKQTDLDCGVDQFIREQFVPPLFFHIFFERPHGYQVTPCDSTPPLFYMYQYIYIHIYMR